MFTIVRYLLSLVILHLRVLTKTNFYHSRPRRATEFRKITPPGSSGRLRRVGRVRSELNKFLTTNRKNQILLWTPYHKSNYANATLYLSFFCVRIIFDTTGGDRKRSLKNLTHSMTTLLPSKGNIYSALRLSLNSIVSAACFTVKKYAFVLLSPKNLPQHRTTQIYFLLTVNLLTANLVRVIF